LYPSEFGERNFGASGDFLFVPLGRPLEGTNLSGSGSKSSGSLPTLAPPLEKPPPREGEKRDDGSSISSSSSSKSDGGSGVIICGRRARIRFLVLSWREVPLPSVPTVSELRRLSFSIASATAAIASLFSIRFLGRNLDLILERLLSSCDDTLTNKLRTNERANIVKNDLTFHEYLVE
jgi:hypothetical protein